MKLIRKNTNKLLLPDYIIKCLSEIDWVNVNEGSDGENVIEFYDNDLLMITYGTRGSTPFSGPECLRYGGNTTSYQIYSPKLPSNYLYIGDGGSGILEIDKAIIKKCFSQGINPFVDSKEKVANVVTEVVNTYTHYHYDHLHTGAPLAGLFHSLVVRKMIIGGWGPRRMFQNVFKRPIFPRDFSEMNASYAFYQIKDPRSSVIIFLPDGDFKEMGCSEFKNLLKQNVPQIKHNKVSHDLANCVVVKCFPTCHPDPCISYRYETYNHDNQIVSSITFMTDHDIRDTDYRETYFRDQVAGCDALYIDGQYENKNYIPGFGHGRVELIGEMAQKLKVPNVAIGHHDPTREDNQIDAMIELAKAANESSDSDFRSNILGASDRMLIFVPAKERGRKGIVIGKMDLKIGRKVEANLTSELEGTYAYTDLTSGYSVHDHTSTT